MKKLVLFSLFVSAFTLSAAAQITITSAVFPVAGDTLHFAFGNQPGAINQIFTPPGGGQQWDLSGLQPSQTWDQIFKNPQSGSAYGNFPAATILYAPVNSSAEVYGQVTGSAVTDLGYFGLDELGLGLNLLFKKSPALEESWAPANFFDIHQSSSNVLTAFDAPIAPPALLNLSPTADSFRIRVTYQRIGVIDAWGTLTIPNGSFDVLRKKQTEYKSTAVDVKVAPLGWIDISTIGGQQVLPLGTDTITTFHFLNDQSKEAIAVCRLNTAQNQVTSVQYKAAKAPSATLLPSKPEVLLSVYPNPAQGSFYARFTSKINTEFQMQLVDNHGQVLSERMVTATTGVNDFAIPGDDLTPGVYQVILLKKGTVWGRTTVIKTK